MNIIKSYSIGNFAYLDIHSGLDTAKPIYQLRYNCENPNYAGLLAERLIKVVVKDYKEACKNPTDWLEPREVSTLKKWLTDHWDSKIHGYKS